MAKNIETIELIHLAFLDTNVIDPTKNNYDRLKSELDILKKHVDKGNVYLITNEIVIKEVQNHIFKEVKSHNEQLPFASNCKELLLLKDNKEYEALFKGFEANKMARDIFSEFKKHLKKLDVQILKNDHISVKKLLKDYFESNPPFSSGDKKSEFPDAIMYQALKRFLNDDEKIHIISSDGDWHKICEQEPNFICHKTIKSFLDYLNKDDQYCEVIRNYLSSKNAHKKIFENLEDIIYTTQFKVYGGYTDRDGIFSGFDYDYSELEEILNLDFNLDTIDDIVHSEKADSAVITILCYADLVMRCTYFDEEHSIWDDEEHRYIHSVYEGNIEKHEFIIPVEITLEGGNEKDMVVDNFDIIDTDFDISILDEQTRIDRISLKDYYNYRNEVFQLERIFKCPYCERDIKLDLISDETECVCSDERSMGIENEYAIKIQGICPHCRKAYRVSGKIWEYPLGSYNCEEDVKITKR